MVLFTVVLLRVGGHRLGLVDHSRGAVLHGASDAGGDLAADLAALLDDLSAGLSASADDLASAVDGSTANSLRAL